MHSKINVLGVRFLSKILLILVLSFSISLSVSAWFSDIFGWWTPEVKIDCWGWKECNINTGTELVKNTVHWIETERWISEYIQDIIVNILTYISIIAVVYIIYAWFRILTWAWDEENLKKQKSTILYVAIWIIIIWLAYPITLFIINLLN